MTEPRHIRTSQTPVQLIREMQTRAYAIRQYARAHDRFAEIEQANAGTAEGEGAHRFAMWTLRAVRAELDDPEPRRG
jgi:hypothetical protein